MTLQKLTIDLYKDLKEKAEQYAIDEKNATTESNRLISMGEKRAFEYAARKIRLNFEWLDIDF